MLWILMHNCSMNTISLCFMMVLLLIEPGAIQRWLEEHGVSETNDFPPNSPGLNIIEHIWAIMKHNFYSHTLLYNTRTLESAVKRSWNKVELAKIRVLVASMPRRIQACIDAEGGTTTY